jgi:predicted nucleic acid-binding protein
VTGFLLDTNVLSELSRSMPESRVTNWIEANNEQSFFVSVLTLAEIRKGILLQHDRARRSNLEQWREQLIARFGERVLPVDAAVADAWADIMARSAAQPVPPIDALLAATALHYNLILVTRNTKDVARTGVDILNPWRA